MPAFITGPLTIYTVGGLGVVNFGGALYISPKTATKSLYGSGSSHTAATNYTFNGVSTTNTVDNNLVDQTVTSNN